MIAENVQVVDPKTTYVDEQATVGEGTTIYPSTTILGKTVIGKNCEIGPNSVIQDSEIADNSVVFFSVVKNSEMGEGSDIGPFSHLRDHVKIGIGVHIGNYVEMVRTIVADGTHIGHVTYLGDTEVGRNVNIGAGTITANYDGKNKYKTIIEEGALIGANTVFVAPVTVGRGAKTAAGSVIKKDVVAGTLVAGVPAEFKKKL